MSFLSKEVKKEIRDILIIVLGWTFFNTFFFQVSFVPSGSMRPQLLVGDIVVVNKFIYGVRLPRTAAVPFLEKTLPWTPIPSYVRLPIPYIRMLKFSKIKRGHVVVFNTPTERKEHPHHRTPFVKRVVGLPGDRVRLEQGRAWVNGVIEKNFNDVGRKMRYYVQTKPGVYRSFFTRKGGYEIAEEDVKVVEDGGYYLYVTAKIAAKVQRSSAVISVEERSDTPLYCDMEEVVVPKKGMKIMIDEATCRVYGNLIRFYEGNRKVVIENGTLFINGRQISEYTFKMDYIFVLGDNFFNSWDSRFWGFVPMSHVMGKAVFILLGGRDGQKGGEEWWRRIWFIPLLRGKFTFKRSFKKIR